MPKARGSRGLTPTQKVELYAMLDSGNYSQKQLKEHFGFNDTANIRYYIRTRKSGGKKKQETSTVLEVLKALEIVNVESNLSMVVDKATKIAMSLSNTEEDLRAILFLIDRLIEVRKSVIVMPPGTTSATLMTVERAETLSTYIIPDKRQEFLDTMRAQLTK